jgi:antagonist of KipI
MLRVAEAGLLTTVQDLGRHGYQRDGVPVSGAMDPFALRVANLLVGNDPGAAGLEATLSGPVLEFAEEALIALAGADPGALLDGVVVPPWRPVRVPAGSTLALGAARRGCRAYLAVAGGIDVPRVLGSRSTFVRAALGGHRGRELRRGNELPVGSPAPLARRIAADLGRGGAGPAIARWGAGPSWRPAYSDRAMARLLPGTHADALTPDAREALFRAEFRVSPRSDRTGYRLEGPRLELAAPLEILSEAVAFGTLQLPPDGEPIVLMADRQTTGGYPRIGEVASVDLPLLAQLRPGDRVSFRPCSLPDAQALLLARERDLARFRLAIEMQYRRYQVPGSK